MRPGPALLLALALTALALLPGMALADGGHEHGSEGPANPMVKAVTLYLDASGGLAPEPAAAGAVPAGPATPDGTSTPVAWTVAATKNTKLESSIFVELFAAVEQPTLVAGGPEGAAFKLQLAHNGEPVEGAASLQKIPDMFLQPGTEYRLKVFLPQVELGLAPGDTLGLEVSFFGLNPEGEPAVKYKVGGEAGSRMVFRLRMAGIAELELPKEVGPWPVAPLEGFDFQAAAKKDPSVKEVTLRAFQFGFRGAPVVVENGTRVVLHLTVDETLGVGEGHGAHAHDTSGAAWDQSIVTPLHGFGLASLDPRLQTVLFEGLVVTMDFVADKPGNHTFLCTVFCGSGHGRMLDTLRVLGEEPPPGDVSGSPVGDGAAEAKTPGFEAALLLAGLAAAGIAARRRGKA